MHCEVQSSGQQTTGRLLVVHPGRLSVLIIERAHSFHSVSQQVRAPDWQPLSPLPNSNEQEVEQTSLYCYGLHGLDSRATKQHWEQHHRASLWIAEALQPCLRSTDRAADVERPHRSRGIGRQSVRSFRLYHQHNTRRRWPGTEPGSHQPQQLRGAGLPLSVHRGWSTSRCGWEGTSSWSIPNFWFHVSIPLLLCGLLRPLPMVGHLEQGHHQPEREKGHGRLHHLYGKRSSRSTDHDVCGHPCS